MAAAPPPRRVRGSDAAPRVRPPGHREAERCGVAARARSPRRQPASPQAAARRAPVDRKVRASGSVRHVDQAGRGGQAVGARACESACDAGAKREAERNAADCVFHRLIFSTFISVCWRSHFRVPPRRRGVSHRVFVKGRPPLQRQPKVAWHVTFSRNSRRESFVA